MRFFTRRERGDQRSVQDLPEVVMRPIGIVRSNVHDPRRATLASGESEIELDPRYTPALGGLDGFSHIIVLCWLDQVSEEERQRMSERPGGVAGLPDVGVLALRTHHRPNPIGMTVVPLVRVDGARLRVRGLDAVDGTPVLDIKPYVPHYDSLPGARLPRWATGEADD